MTPHDKIKAWLEDKSRTFAQGFDLFVTYSRNRNLMLMLARKQNIEKLTYELEKMLTYELKADVAKVPAPVVRKLSDESKAEKELRQVTGQLDQAFAVETSHLKRIKRESLPAAQQVIHDEISEAYKLQRVYHEKMKLAETDEDRAAARAEIVRLDDLISAGWKGLDAFVKSGEKIPAVAKVGTVLEISKEINACRSYVSRSISDLPKLADKKKPQRIADVQARIEKLIALKAPVKKETRASLVTLGIIGEDSSLVGE